MPVVDTKNLFETSGNKEQLVSKLLASSFPHTPPEAIYFEMLQQGFSETGMLVDYVNYWGIVDQTLSQLQQEWGGPNIPVFLFPITEQARKNGVAYKNSICLFVSQQVTKRELQALFAHEYHHICRRSFIDEPPTLMDSILMEGLAEHAVEALYGETYLSPWTKLYCWEEVQTWWGTISANLQLRGIKNHRPFLYGDAAQGFPPWIGYCAGYRIVEAWQQQSGTKKPSDLFFVKAEQFIQAVAF